MFKGMTAKEFNKTFKSDDDCRLYLFRLKWAGGYQCRKCGNKKYHKGKSKFHYRCTECLYGESPTANTIFHKMKVPLLKAFGMIFRISVRKKGISTLELSREFGVNKKTAWLFKRKMQEIMSGFQNIPLKDPIDSASFTFGGAELEWRSKFQGEESLAKLMVEKTNLKKLGTARGWMSLEGGSGELKKNLKSAVDGHVPKIVSEKNEKTLLIKASETDNTSQSGKSGVQILIFNLKNWLRGIHHHCSGRFANGYLQEYIFRFNRRNNLKMILHQVIEAGIYHEPYFYRPIKPYLGNRPVEEKAVNIL